jgi:hypothetical protein
LTLSSVLLGLTWTQKAVITLDLVLEAQEELTPSRTASSAPSISSVLLELEIHSTVLALLVASAP